MTDKILEKQVSASDYMEAAYLDYSMYVILDRALPSIADGLKPVQRRIIYAMNELHLDSKSKHKKSARTVGDVLGKYHPHGDSACYEAMVAMAQPFTYRMPLIDGQGNWGSTDDPKSFAAMRYTEARMTPYSNLLLSELKSNTVDYVPNFDGSLTEPVVLPAQVPNILLNGASGIAVGMATDIPPHNINEVIEATKYIIDNPEAKLEDVIEIIKAPDFPTGGDIISSKADILSAYKTGRGSIKARAKYKVEKNDIIIYELPHQVSGSKILEQIGAMYEAKKLPMIDDLQDESDKHNPVRIVISLKRGAKLDADSFMAHLFSATDLEKSYKINLNMIGLDGSPRVKGLVEILEEWAAFRRITVTKRIENRVKNIEARLHIIDGLLVAYLNIDRIIEIIRTEDKPKDVLISEFDLSDIQAESILNIRLRSLAKLEEAELNKEKKDLLKELKELNKILSSKKDMNDLIKEEMDEVLKTYSSERRSTIVDASSLTQAKSLTETDLVAAESVTVVLSEKGWVRMGKGHSIDDKQLSYKSGDGAGSLLRTKTNQPTVVINEKGRSYTIKTHTLPSARGYGEQLIQHIEPESGVAYVGLVNGGSDEYIMLASKEGYGFKCKSSELVSANKKGKAVLNTEGKTALPPILIGNSKYIGILTNQSNVLIFETDELKELSKGKGVKLCTLAKDDFIKQTFAIDEGDRLLINVGDKEVNYGPDKVMGLVNKRARKPKTLAKYMKDITVKVVKKDNEL